MKKMNMKKMILSALALMLVVSGKNVYAATENFAFSIEPTKYDMTAHYATKDDNEQRAYVTPTSISGTGAVWLQLTKNGVQCTPEVGIAHTEANVHKTTDYYLYSGQGTSIRLTAGDPEWQVLSSVFNVAGRWTP